MIKRPLALFSVVFVMILVFLMSFHNSVFLRNPVESSGDGRKQIAGFLQDDVVTVYGNISNYSYQDQYGQTTTEVILKDVHILLPLEEQSLDIVNMQDKMTAALLTESRWKKVTQNGQQILVYINKEETLSIGEQILISSSSFLFPSSIAFIIVAFAAGRYISIISSCLSANSFSPCRIHALFSVHSNKDAFFTANKMSLFS